MKSCECGHGFHSHFESNDDGSGCVACRCDHFEEEGEAE